MLAIFRIATAITKFFRICEIVIEFSYRLCAAFVFPGPLRTSLASVAPPSKPGGGADSSRHQGTDGMGMMSSTRNGCGLIP
jgi:hypothetical protein